MSQIFGLLVVIGAILVAVAGALAVIGAVVFAAYLVAMAVRRVRSGRQARRVASIREGVLS